MPRPPSFQRLPRWVDARKFAQQGVALQGQIPQSDLPRLAQAVSRVETPVEARLQFGIDESGVRTMTGSLRVTVSAVCQRCMGETGLDLSLDLALGIVSGDAEFRQLPKHLEPWTMDRDVAESDLYQALEDELLLGLPMVVYHDYQCIDEELYSAGDADTAAAPEQDKRNPFQVLAQLKGREKK